MDFVDIFTEELADRKTPSPRREQAITSRTLGEVDQLSNDVDISHCPAPSGLPLREQQMELPIMPMEHWLGDEEQCRVPVTRLLNDTIQAHRIPRLEPISSLGTGQTLHHEHPPQDVLVSDSSLPATSHALAEMTLGSAIADRPSTRHHVDRASRVPEASGTSFLGLSDFHHALVPSYLNDVSVRAPSDPSILLDPLDRKMTPTAYTSKVKVRENYQIVGFISSGTYGRVYKAVARNKPGETISPTSANSSSREVFAIKKFKPDKEGETIQYTGLSQSAIREISLCSELSHPNLIHLVEIILEDKCIYMVFEYCEHDLLQIIHHHTQPTRRAIPPPMMKSILFQLLNGLLYLHRNWVLHRDLKPANIMVTSNGAVRIGDLGLARLFYKPLTSLFSGDKVVVTIWYRSPDLLLGSKHYTPAVDLWAVGCIFAELLSLRPIFKGEEAKMDSKKTVPFQRNQMIRIIDVLGLPTKEDWPGIVEMPEYAQLQSLAFGRTGGSAAYNSSSSSTTSTTNPGHNSGSASRAGLETWYNNVLRSAGYPTDPADSDSTPGPLGFDLLAALLTYDPHKRPTAEDALEHPYFRDDDGKGKVNIAVNCFEGLEEQYPHRRVSSDDNGIGTGSLPGTKRGGLPDDSLVPSAKKRA